MSPRDNVFWNIDTSNIPLFFYMVTKIINIENMKKNRTVLHHIRRIFFPFLCAALFFFIL